MYCRQCGTKLDDHAKFCGYCGTPVEQKKAPEPVIIPETAAEPEPVAEPLSEPAASGEEPAAWAEPVSEMEWEAPASEDVWSDTAANTSSENTNQTGATWSDTWSETAQTSGWNFQSLNEVPLIIEPKKKQSVVLTILTILGIVALVTIVVIFAVLMNGGSSEAYSDGIWYSNWNEDSYDEEESGESAFIGEEEESEISAGVTLGCGVEIPFNATSVDLSGMTVNDLIGIEQCTMLQSIRVNGGSLADISPILSLTQLNSLTLNNVPVSDIQVLKNMPSLLYLDITDTQVSSQQVKDLKAALPNLTVIGYASSTYEIVKKDCTWMEAVEICENMGGHLVTVSDKTEMEKVKKLLKDTDLNYFWMGGYSQGDTWFWITGEAWGGYENWFPGEPSKQDTDGTPEDCLCLWNVDDKGWTMNDQRDDLPSFSSTQGRMGFICEYEVIAGYQE